ncbi:MULTISPECIES: hypothetical protein [Gordonia]|uniref:Uncharacterized protein n=1 Tax=Gordonia sihwensis NBRC 108236 TaxID=1223544 RepID=L7LR58_9ACTN|nr:MULTISPECIES: hypothetical protein [Gordonia]AUH69674.1 hypothetical protein CXX93_16805 [Gordonia sp. YC-JH1]GAC62657.1 hypothetical protein GSI01S_39_00550 [Gordonia sihwensis NBRC 108236]
MTLIMRSLEPGRITVITDTLAKGVGRTPDEYHRKIVTDRTRTHLFTGSGDGRTLAAWLDHMAGQTCFTPQAAVDTSVTVLRSLWDLADHVPGDHVRARVFGFSGTVPAEGFAPCPFGYLLESASGFSPQAMDQRFGQIAMNFCPDEDELRTAPSTDVGDPNQCFKLAQWAKPVSDRHNNPVGGDVWLTTLTRSGVDDRMIGSL